MAHHTPEAKLEELKRQHEACEHNLQLKQTKQQELSQRIKDLEKLLGEIQKAYEDYKKQHGNFDESEQKLNCFHDNLSDPPDAITDCVERIIAEEDAKIDEKETTLKQAQQCKQGTAAALAQAVDDVESDRKAFDALKARTQQVANLITDLKARQDVINQVACEPAEVYFLKLEFKKRLEELGDDLVSPEKLLEELRDAWGKLQEQKDKLAEAHQEDIVAGHALSDAAAAHQAAVDARDETIRQRVNEECQLVCPPYQQQKSSTAYQQSDASS